MSPEQRAEIAATARRITAELAYLRLLVASRAGESNAAMLHDHAARGVHQLLAATGVYGIATEVRRG